MTRAPILGGAATLLAACQPSSDAARRGCGLDPEAVGTGP